MLIRGGSGFAVRFCGFVWIWCLRAGVGTIAAAVLFSRLILLGLVVVYWQLADCYFGLNVAFVFLVIVVSGYLISVGFWRLVVGGCCCYGDSCCWIYLQPFCFGLVWVRCCYLVGCFGGFGGVLVCLLFGLRCCLGCCCKCLVVVCGSGLLWWL